MLTLDLIKGLGPFHAYFRIKLRGKDELTTFEKCKHFLGRTKWDKSVQTALNPVGHYYHCEEILREPFYSARWKGTPSTKTIFCVSSEDLRKGILLLIDAMPLLSSFGLENVQLRVAGLSPGSSFWQIVRRRLRRNKIDSQIHMLGPLCPVEIAREMMHASVFVLPSYIDNSPNTVAEAMLVGVPVISAFVGGIPSLVGDEEEGLLFPSGDKFLLAHSIARLLKNPDLSRKLSKNARATALVRHGPQTVANSLASIYREILCFEHSSAG
ncbi:MAG: glycosyltransferase family 4 protein [Deltaproteobacteria bacterium]|nr:glycosyltransferase family 4 protein [Deltaproteobacteria bacterium]